MTIYFANNAKQILSVSVGLLLPIFSYAAGGDFTDIGNFMDDVAESAVQLHCADITFLEHAGLDKTNCKEVVNQYTKQCNDLMRILVPPITGTEEDTTNVEKLKHLGELYSLCLKALVYERGVNE